MTESQRIGQRAAIKYGIIGIVVLILILLITWFVLIRVLHAVDWPVVIGGKQIKTWLLITVPCLGLILGWFVARLTGRWAGRMIIDKGKSPFWYAALSLVSTYSSVLVIILKLPGFVLAFILSVILARFMGREIGEHKLAK